MDRFEKVKQEWARREHKEFVKYTWNEAHSFIEGKHLDIICERIDKALDDYAAGKSTFLVIAVPFRHGKSQVISRYLPVNFIGKHPDAEVIAASHSQAFSNKLSRYARKVFNSKSYQSVYKNVRISSSSFRVGNWEIEGHNGSTTWAGIGTGIGGSGYSLGILDDYLKDRKSAESQIIRDNQWEWFTQVFLSRRAPVSITIVISTPWHTDDIIGRISKAKDDDPEFPDFEFLRFPGISQEYETGYLWPERFSESWYKSQRASLSSYGFQSLMQCDPVTRGGNVFQTDLIKIVDEIPDGLRFVRGWDLASSKKEKLKTNPDWTVGVSLAVRYVDSPFKEISEKIPQIFVRDVERIREEAPTRNERIKELALREKVKIGVEAFGAYKDAYTTMYNILNGLVMVEKMQLPGDKMTKAEPLEPIIAAGNFHILRGPWNDEYIKEFSDFPSGAHDDQVDATAVSYELANDGGFDFSGHSFKSGK